MSVLDEMILEFYEGEASRAPLAAMKPCPFCGGERLAVVVDLPSPDEIVAWSAYVSCQRCHAQGPIGSVKATSQATTNDLYNAAVEAWGRRGQK